SCRGSAGCRAGPRSGCARGRPRGWASGSWACARCGRAQITRSRGESQRPRAAKKKAARSGLWASTVRAASGDFHRDLARLHLLGLRQRQLEHAVAVARLHRLLVDLRAETQAAHVASIAHLAPQVLLAFLALLIGFALGRDREQSVLERHVDVFLAHARQIGTDHVLVLALLDIHRGNEGIARRLLHPANRAEKAFEYAVEIVAEEAPTSHRRAVASGQHPAHGVPPPVLRVCLESARGDCSPRALPSTRYQMRLP